MSRARLAASGFDAVAVEGSLLPADWLARIAALDTPRQAPDDYGIPKGLNLRDELGRYWRIANAHWQDYAKARDAGADLTAPTRRFITALLRDVFGTTDLALATAPTLPGERVWPITAFAGAGRLPIVIGTPEVGLDKRDAAFGEAGRQRSAFGLLQDYLNASDTALWGIAANGDTLRLARDNASLSRPTWIEADLARIFSEERFADFSLLWLLIHASRFGRAGEPVAQCPLEAWREASREEGTRAREALRGGVTQALQEIGQGFIVHPANAALREKLRSGELSAQDYFRQLLRLVYRLIFLLTIEERGLLHPEGADPDAVRLYAEGYGLRRLVDRARRRRAWDRHADLWQGLQPVFTGLAHGQPLLALPALGGLFAAGQCPDLDGAELPNRALLAALFALGWLRQGGALARTNWRDMKYEEFGSVYESLLELVPDVRIEAQAFGFAQADQSRGNERKTSGSYYTPDALVQQLLDSALEPVIEQRLAAAADPEAALLAITVCDPACGSGHFLLAAAFRLADRLARIRAGGTPGGTEYRTALRDVVSHCIHGVDINPMALELARTALWLEAMTPDKPLGFLDHHLQCGDALLGVLDTTILDAGIPDDAFAALTGDDKAVAALAKKQNKTERDSWQRALATSDLFAAEQLAAQGAALEQLTDDSLAAIDAKRAAWQAARQGAQASRLARLADLYVGAYLLPKTQRTQTALPSSRHLWAVANDETVPSLAEAEAAAGHACREANVLHWWLAFPGIHAQGGFAVLLANPPWEMLQLDPQEFFASSAPEVANAPHMAARNRMIEALVANDPRLHQEYLGALRTMEATQSFVHASGRFPKSGFGRINLASLFAETVLHAVAFKAAGHAGMVLPSGIATDSFTQYLFNEIVGSRRLTSLLDFENSQGVFPSVHRSYKFSLLTLGRAEAAHFTCFITQVAHLADARRAFTLTPDEFALINPNTRTCPVFRSARDAELTKAIYRRVPVLIREAVKDDEGKVITPEINHWDINFQLMFMMNTDSGLFRDQPAQDRLPLYEAKMIHQFDHRWASYAPTAGGGVETVDVPDAQKADADFTITPRYWVDTREVLARIARVPSDVRKHWLAAPQAANPAERAKTLDALWLALAAWVAGELFRREAGTSEDADGSYADRQCLRAASAVEKRLATSYPACLHALRTANLTSKKLLKELPKWARRDAEVPLDDTELATLARFAGQPAADAREHALLAELDAWMDRRSPRWLIGWRRNARSTDDRTTIATIIPRVAAGDSIFMYATGLEYLATVNAALLANLNCLPLDYVARQKVGGMNYSFYYFKQLPVLPPSRYTAADLAFIVPRVLELTYTAHDLADWARDLGYTGAPFPWNPDRRAHLRADLDAYYARLYGLNRDELRYILDPSDVMGADYPSETFRVLKNNDQRQYGHYRTQRLVLAAWDNLHQGGLH